MAKHVLDLMPHENGKETSGSASWKISRATRASASVVIQIALVDDMAI